MTTGPPGCGTPVRRRARYLAGGPDRADIFCVHLRRPRSMSVPSTARARSTSRLRRGSAAAVVIVAGLVLSGTAVVSAGAPMPAAPANAAANVVGLKKGAYGDNVRALQEALNRV